jgi:hypothetical protein
MSLVVERYLICDGNWCEANTIDNGKDYPNGFILRIEAKKNGWHSEGTRDLCPECWAKRAGGKGWKPSQ